ncbi:MAG: HDIG domain-containing metalloprotein [Thermoleophilaceae bacterium]
MTALDGQAPVRAVRAALGEREGVWIVGGTVRDALLGRDVSDVDLAVSGDAEPAARAVAAAVRGPVFSMSDDFGTWRAIDREGGWVCDVSPLQAPTLEGDLALRDFTVNAMAVPLAGGDPVDPQGGRADLDAGVLRVLGPEAYERDPLRPLRLARLATELPLAPEPETERLTAAAAPQVTRASAERVFAELRRIVVAERALHGLELAERLGLMKAVLPELHDLQGVEQSSYHHLDVHEHTREVLREQVALETGLEELFGELAPRVESVLAQPLADELTRGQALRFGALLHDIAKPATREVRPDGRVTFMGHDSLGDEMIAAICTRLRTSTRLREYIGALARHHLVLGFLVHQRPLAPRTVYHYVKRTEPVAVEVTVLSCADRRATRGRNAEEAIATHLELARELMAAALAWREQGPPTPLLRGGALARELDIEPGPELGRLLAELEAAQYAGEVTTRDEAVAHARSVRQNRA